MGFFDSLFGRKEEPIKQIATSQWSGYLASLIASMIQEAKLDDLNTMAAFVSKVNNGVGLRAGEKGALPNFTDDSYSVAYCYLRDVEMWPKFYETMGKLLVLDFQSAKMLADATGEKLGLFAEMSGRKEPV
jgi:hypothetical protein